MKTIGLLGGLSWVSTALYYELLNKLSADHRGPGYQPPLLLKSYDYRALFDLEHAGRMDEIGGLLAKGAQDLESIGADVIAICANTMHKFYDQVQNAVAVPILHVADACGTAIVNSGFSNATLLGTRNTMEGTFYRDRLREKFGIDTVVPDAGERTVIERVIRDELTKNEIRPESREAYLRIIDRHAEEGSQCAILGCTEIGLLVKQSETSHPLFDTTILHCEALIEWALG